MLILTARVLKSSKTTAALNFLICTKVLQKAGQTCDSLVSGAPFHTLYVHYTGLACLRATTHCVMATRWAKRSVWCGIDGRPGNDSPFHFIGREPQILCVSIICWVTGGLNG